MFFSISLCAKDPNVIKGPKKVHYYALLADTILGLALLAIGIAATQLSFLPNNLQYAFIGAGAAYTFGTLSGIGAILKMFYTHSKPVE